MPGPSGDTHTGKGTDAERLVRVEERLRAESQRSEERHVALMGSLGETTSMLKIHFDEDRAWWSKIDKNTAALQRNQDNDTNKHAAIVERVSRLEDQTDRIVIADAPSPATAANDKPPPDGLRLHLTGRTLALVVLGALGGGAGIFKAIEALMGAG